MKKEEIINIIKEEVRAVLLENREWVNNYKAIESLTRKHLQAREHGLALGQVMKNMATMANEIYKLQTKNQPSPRTKPNKGGN